MKSIPGPLQAHLDGGNTTLALCWRIVKRDSNLILGCDHDRDIIITTGPLAGTYRAQSNITPSNIASNNDLAVDNLEVKGALADGTVRIDISSVDIEARNLDFAAVKSFFVNWNAPDQGQVPMRTGFFGQITYDSTYGYKVELRGLAQLLQQNIVQTYSDKCNVKHFGDSRCKVNVAALSSTATVTAVTDRRQFTVSGYTQPTSYYPLGNLLGLMGANTGFLQQIRVVSGTLTVTLFEAFPKDVAPGDTFTISPGCDRLPATCLNRYNNIVNNRAYGIYIPGIDALLAGPAGVTLPGQPP